MDKNLKVFYANKFKPTFVFDKNEKYLPCSMSHYIKHCDLYIGNDVAIPAGKLNYKTLIKNCATTNTQNAWRDQLSRENNKIYQGDFSLKPTEDLIYGQPDWQNKAKIYCQAFKVTVEENHVQKELYAFKYIFTYAYDNPNSALNFLFKKNQTIDYHYSDIEHCEVLTTIGGDGLPDKIHKVYYAAHGSGEGKWYSQSQLQQIHSIENESHPIVYVARGSHASYPKPGHKIRILGLFNDVNEPKNIKWDARVSLHCKLLNLQPGINYGLNAVSTHQDYLDEQTNIKNYSTTPFMRNIGILFSSSSIYEKVKTTCMKLSHTTIKSTVLPVEKTAKYK